MIELLPEEAKDKTKQKLMTRLLAVGLVILIWGASLYLHQSIIGWKQKSSRLTTKIKELAAQKEKTAAEIRRRKKYRQVINRANLADYLRIVKDLRLIIPAEIWLKRFKINDRKKVFFTGQAEKNQQIITTIQRIIKYPYFKQVELAAKNQSQDIVTFQLLGSIDNGK